MNQIHNIDCMELLPTMQTGGVDLTLTDIPYNAVNRDSNGLRNFDKGNADIMTFDLNEFLDEIYRVTSGTIIIFCGKEQFSTIFKFFADKQGTTRQIIWNKTNPSPANGQYVYLSSTENAVWFKKKGGTFNAHCKGTVFNHPCGRAKLHPTEKNHGLLKELILDNSNENEIVFDPCCGSGSHLLMAKELGRQYLGCEIDKSYFNIAKERIENT